MLIPKHKIIYILEEKSMTISSGEIKRNMTILLQDEIYQILEWQHRQAPKAPPTLTLKLRHIESGNVYEKKVPGNQKLELAPTDIREAQFLYKDKDLFVFMDNSNFEQYELDEKIVGDASKYLSEGNSISIIFLEVRPLAIELPSSMTLTIENTEVGLKGDTQSGATKPATTTTGLTLQVPLFIENGQEINISTSDGSYLGRN
tara:strand:+ start:1719 stop:2327 length:609 start_codon:yes stop_codon:yes gene_type:complete